MNQYYSICKDISKSFTFQTAIFQFIVFFMTKLHTIYLMGKYSEQQDDDLEEYYFNCVLYKWGAKYTPSIRYHFQYWRLVFPIFLHSSLAHIIGNMITQISYGFIAEITQGRSRTAILYIAGGLGASLFSCVINTDNIAVGASGAIYSLVVLELVEIIKTYPKINQDDIYESITLCLMIFVALIDSPPQVDVAAHFGGLLVGLLISTGYAFADSRNHKNKKYQYIFYGIVGILYIFLLIKIYDDNIEDEQICKEFNII